jgi:flavin reductase (DIM6/NTAB) family NADH-FMN oxidoreductase RutF
VIGVASFSQTAVNLMRTGECVLNLPSPAEVRAVDAIARTTGTHPVPAFKQAMGYVYEPDKFARAGMAPVASETVAAPRALECPIQLEAVFAAQHGINDDNPDLRGLVSLFELRITRVHVHPSLLMAGHSNRIDPFTYNELTLSFIYAAKKRLELVYVVSRRYAAPPLLAALSGPAKAALVILSITRGHEQC